MKLLTKANSILVVIAVGLLVSWATLAVAKSSSDQLGDGRSANPNQFRAGTVDPSAVAAAKNFSEFPVAWLGEEYAGFKLTKMFHADSEGQNAVYIIYGNCEDDPAEPEPSCVPPLEIVTSAPGTIPAPEDERIMNAGNLTSARGAVARTLSGSPFIWTEGAVITIHANGPFVAGAIENLRSANHAVLGFDEVSPGDDLRAFGR